MNSIKKHIRKSHKNKKITYFSSILFFVVCFCVIVYFVYRPIYVEKIRTKDYFFAYNELFQNNNREELKKFFLNDVDLKVNDKYTKSAIYYITHSYMENGGNIYEIYDYVNSNPQLSFLKEAESIYPEYFNLILNRKLPFSYSDQAMYVYLAYLEILVKYNYADIATIGALSDQYAVMAFYKNTIRNDQLKGYNLNYPKYSEVELKKDVEKAKNFSKIGEPFVNEILTSKNIPNIPDSDIVSGLVQYASALRYLEALNEPLKYSFDSRDIFNYLFLFTRKSATDFYLFVALSNASTLLLVPTSDLELRNAIYPFLDYTKNSSNKNSVVTTILQSRFRISPSRFADLTIDSKDNILALAKRVPEFKTWLMNNGWQESDFK